MLRNGDDLGSMRLSHMKAVKKLFEFEFTFEKFLEEKAYQKGGRFDYKTFC